MTVKNRDRFLPGYLESAIELGYDDIQVLEFLGLAQFKLLKLAESAATLSRIADSIPSNARPYKFLPAAEAQIGAETALK